jgi:hypothetical protein
MELRVGSVCPFAVSKFMCIIVFSDESTKLVDPLFEKRDVSTVKICKAEETGYVADGNGLWPGFEKGAFESAG